MKESKHKADKGLIFRETFNSEADVRRNGGVPTDTTFEDGLAKYPGVSSGAITYANRPLLAGYYTIRFRFKYFTESTYRYLFTRRFADGSSSTDPCIRIYNVPDTLEVNGVSNDNIYVNGVDTNTITTGSDKEIVAVFRLLDDINSFYLFGYTAGGGNGLFGSEAEFVEIYNYRWSAEEVANAYNKSRLIDLKPKLDKREQLGDEEMTNYDFSTGDTTGWSFTDCIGDVGSYQGKDNVCRCTITNNVTIYPNQVNVTTVGRRYYYEAEVYIPTETTGGSVALAASTISYIDSSSRKNRWITLSGYITTPDVSTDFGMIYLAGGSIGEPFYVNYLSIKEVITEETKTILDVNAFGGSVVNRLAGSPAGDVLNVNSCTNSNYTTFSGGSSTGFTVTSDGGGTHAAGTADEIDLYTGGQYLVSFQLTLNSGTAPAYDFKNDFAGAGKTSDGAQTAVVGSNIHVFTANAISTTVLEFSNTSTATDYSISSLVVRELIPEPTITNVDVVKDGDVRVMQFGNGGVNPGLYDDFSGSNTTLFWIKIDKYTLGDEMYFFSNDKFEIRVLSSFSNFYAYGGAGSYVQSVTTLYDMIGVWTLVTFVKDSVNKDNCKMYTNGSLERTSDTVSSTSTNALKIGANYNNTYSTTGKISAFRIIDGLLTAEEISQIYTSEKHLYNK